MESAELEAIRVQLAPTLEELALEIPETFIDKAKVLDNFYVPTRYASGHPEGAPFEHYGKLQSEDAIRYASEILKFVRNKIFS